MTLFVFFSFIDHFGHELSSDLNILLCIHFFFYALFHYLIYHLFANFIFLTINNFCHNLLFVSLFSSNVQMFLSRLSDSPKGAAQTVRSRSSKENVRSRSRQPSSSSRARNAGRATIPKYSKLADLPARERTETPRSQPAKPASPPIPDAAGVQVGNK